MRAASHPQHLIRVSGTVSPVVRASTPCAAWPRPGALFPWRADTLTSGDNLSGTSLTDQYFQHHDEVFNNAVDHWTPRPGEVGTAGQVAGQLAGGVMQAIISPALLVGTAQMSSAEDLVRNGVDANTANTVGGIQGVSMAVGLKLPFLGQSLATRVLSGAGGNLVQGTATALASSQVLKAQGHASEAERFNPWDLRARTLDVMMGAAFGGLAHLEAKGASKLTPQQDYQLFLAEFGLTQEKVDASMNNKSDLIPMPKGVSKIERLKSPIEGDGMFTTEKVGDGELLAPGRIGGMRTPAGRFTNHSNEPNAELRPHPNGDLDLVALGTIEAGKEVVIDYRQAAEVNGSGLKNATKLPPTDEAALLVANQARHMEDSTPQGRPATDADATMHTDAMRQSIEQVLRGETVTVDGLTKDMRMVADDAQLQQRTEFTDELQRIAALDAPIGEPIPPKIGADSMPVLPRNAAPNDLMGAVKQFVNHMLGGEDTQQRPEINPADHDPASLKARQFAQDQPELTIPTNHVDANGNPIHLRASDAIAMADAEVAHAQSTAASLFKTAAHCLLGVL